MSANITLRFATVDVHHDDGIVISTLAGGAKLWVVYPPTTHNMSSLARLYSDPDALFEVSFSTFQNGILLLQRDGQTVYVPPNCPHFVFTLSSCILYGCEITPPSVFAGRIKSLRATVASARSSGGKRLHETLTAFIQGLEGALMDTTSVHPVLDAWVQEADYIGSVFTTDGKAVLACLENVWRKFFRTTSLTSCPACGTISGEFDHHFQSSHLTFLPFKNQRRGRS